MRTYRNFTITFNPKSIPDPSNDYDFWHDDYDGPEDCRCGTAASVKECMILIDEIIHEDEG